MEEKRAEDLVASMYFLAADFLLNVRCAPSNALACQGCISYLVLGQVHSAPKGRPPRETLTRISDDPTRLGAFSNVVFMVSFPFS